jgi:flagellum-specific ATP synthase
MPGAQQVDAEVVGFHGERLYLMPATDIYGLAPGAVVEPLESCPYSFPHIYKPFIRRRRIEDRIRQVAVGPELLGRVIDGAGRPLDRLGPLEASRRAPLHSAGPINPMEREPIKDVLDVGVRAINALLTVGRGQRMGLFAGSGVGKSMLLGMMARYTAADVVVVGLIGERGREVKDFIENILGEEGLKRAAVVAAPADSPPLLRLHGAAYATSIAEHFRDQGLHVLLIMDSLTRFAQAQREIALAVGEPPATKGYPPSVFAKLPQLVERAGNGRKGGGSITAFLYRAHGRGRPAGSGGRCRPGHPGWAHRPVAATGGPGPLPAIDIEASVSRAITELLPGKPGAGAPLPGLVRPLPAQPRPDHHRRLRAWQRPAIGRSDQSIPKNGGIPCPGLSGQGTLCPQPGATGGFDAPVLKPAARGLLAFVGVLGELVPQEQAHTDQEADGEQAQQANIGTEEFLHDDVHLYLLRSVPLRGWLKIMNPCRSLPD